MDIESINLNSEQFGWRCNIGWVTSDWLILIKETIENSSIFLKFLQLQSNICLKIFVVKFFIWFTSLQDLNSGKKKSDPHKHIFNKLDQNWGNLLINKVYAVKSNLLRCASPISCISVKWGRLDAEKCSKPSKQRCVLQDSSLVAWLTNWKQRSNFSASVLTLCFIFYVQIHVCKHMFWEKSKHQDSCYVYHKT